eukprot:CAMPEP_0172693828 /NCGR_PEP_ID=MMETSP1074-20121228/26272_1 /TAXON_ID=2916 /ORGANISM="Ceratium fusus, Strain PA161109" /LENGTH=60 /DNA_ID=CAMNT_0013514263 /DNA_START=174 /DNA_END=356 /DNA_ORIENTATION=-
MVDPLHGIDIPYVRRWRDVIVDQANNADSDKCRSAAASASSQPPAVGEAAWPRRVGCLPR